MERIFELVPSLAVMQVGEIGYYVLISAIRFCDQVAILFDSTPMLDAVYFTAPNLCVTFNLIDYFFDRHEVFSKKMKLIRHRVFLT